MKISKLSRSVLAKVAVSVAALLLSPAMSRRAHAFGGLWSSEGAPLHESAEAIIFVDNPDSTITAIVQIKYAGPPQKFAWVIPLPGKPSVGVSSYTAFQRLDAATAPRYWVEVTVEGMCMPQDEPGIALDGGPASGGAPAVTNTPLGSVMTMDQGSAGPYDYVTVAVDPTLSDPGKVATDWLTTNGYDLTGLESDVLSPYLRDGLNLLAFKLAKNTDATAIRPVMLTYESALPMIPIRPAALAAQDDMGIQVWVIGPAQAVPENYKSLVLNDALIDWLDGQQYFAGALPAGGVGPFGPYVGKPNNYDALVTAAANEAGGQGFVTELGAPASAYRDKVWSVTDDEQWMLLSSRSYEDGLDAVLTAKTYYGGWDGWKEAVQGATTLPEGVTIDEFGRAPDKYRGVAKVDTAEFLELLDEKVVKPVADTAALLYNGPYLTRLFSTMSAGEMTLDPTFNYNPDLAQFSNIHIVKQFIECGPSLAQQDAPWRIELPQGTVVGEGGGGWPVADGSMPANLEIRMLASSGSGTVLTDNSDEIASQLVKTVPADATDGGVTTSPPAKKSAARSVSARSRVELSGGGKCDVSLVGASTRCALVLWLSLAAAIFTRRWGRGARRP